MSICSIERCSKPIRSKKMGWCQPHYMSYWRHGDPLKSQRAKKHKVGDKEHMLTILDEIDPTKLLVECDCGEKKTINRSEFGATKSCGHLKKQAAHNRKDLKGMKFSRLKVTDGPIKRTSGKLYWDCICDCGAQKQIETSKLTTGWTTSCGCYKLERQIEHNTTHGMYHTPERKTWQEMKQRCYKDTSTSYENYGGRGIKVCDRWLESFENFYKDMGDKPGGHTIDRIDNNGDYEPGNCRWASDITQANNKRNNIVLEIGGEEDTLANWCRKYGMPRWLVYQRIYRDGQDPVLALTP